MFMLGDCSARQQQRPKVNPTLESCLKKTENTKLDLQLPNLVICSKILLARWLRSTSLVWIFQLNR